MLREKYSQPTQEEAHSTTTDDTTEGGAGKTVHERSAAQQEVPMDVQDEDGAGGFDSSTGLVRNLELETRSIELQLQFW